LLLKPTDGLRAPQEVRRAGLEIRDATSALTRHYPAFTSIFFRREFAPGALNSYRQNTALKFGLRFVRIDLNGHWNGLLE